MKTFSKFQLETQKGIGLIFIIVFLSSLLLSCGSNTPQKMVLGTWIRDSGCQYNISATKLEIESTGEGLYSVVAYWPPESGYKEPVKANGIFQTVMGQSMIELQFESHKESIEILFEAKKISFSGCYYSKQ